MTTQHQNITEAYLHEPKGVSTASANEAYLADGASSGSWEKVSAHIGGYIVFDSATPAYQHSATTSDTVLDPTFVVSHAEQFSAIGTPNARLTYTGTPDRHCFLSFNASIKQAGGADRDIELLYYKNGAALEGSRVIRTTSTGSWGSVSTSYDLVLSTNDYIELCIKSSVAVTVDVAQAYLGIQGVPD